MPLTIQVHCSCGRTLRAQPDQAGMSIRCWNCKSELVVPHPNQSGRLLRAMVDAASDLFHSPTSLVILAGAVLLTLAFLIPRAGPVLALALIAAAVRGYGAQVRAPVYTVLRRETATGLPTPIVISVENPEPDHEKVVEEPPGWAGPARGILGVAAALVLAAPILIRNRGQVLPPQGTTPGVLWLMALALAGWLVMPVGLAAAYAHDRHGLLPPRLALKSLVRHPLATLAALLILPLGLLATEGLVAAFAWEQGQLSLMVADLFPPPENLWTIDGRHLSFDYDGTVIDANLSASTSNVVPLYPRGLRRGYTLVGTIPPSLSVGLLEVRVIPWMFEVGPVAYLILRVALTVLILSAAGFLLAIQARWLGIVAALDPRRPPQKPRTVEETG